LENDMLVASVASVIQGRAAITQPPQSSVREAATVMASHGIGALPVVEGRYLIGIFTERDVLTRVIAAGRDVDRTRVEDVMTRRPETVSIDCPLAEALEVMLNGRFRHLPVMSNGEVVGVISMRDIPLEFRLVEHDSSMHPKT
jgi:CBS domain-containing protein